MKWSQGGNGGFEQPKPGSYPARCYKIIDIGTHQDEYQGEKNTRHRIIIGWELDEKMADGKPYVTSEFYTLSLGEKANLRKVLESWRGQALTGDEAKGFDLTKLLGAPCLVSLSLNKNNKVVVNSVIKLPKGMTPPYLVNEKVFFDMEHFDQPVFDAMSDGMKRLITSSEEYQAMQTAAPGQPAEGQAQAGTPAEDIPF